MVLLTTGDLADIFKMSRKHVQNIVVKKKGFPKPYRIGRSLRWSQSEVLNYLEQSRRYSTSATSDMSGQ
jgi:predicted DNA-binding transcriptional regulator AlpA